MSLAPNDRSAWRYANGIRLIVLACAAIATAAILAWLLGLAQRGIDFTDEGYYLNSIADPFIYPISTTQFGFIYYWLYGISGDDIVITRYLNIAITFVLSFGLCFSFFSINDRNGWLLTQKGLYVTITISSVLASISLACFNYVLFTPNYNSLAFQALLLAGTGYLLALRSKTELIGWIVIGVAVWLALMAKPSTALAVAAVTAIYALALGKVLTRGFAVSVAVAAVLACGSALLIDGSLMAFAMRINGGLQVAFAMGDGHTISEILRIDDFTFTPEERRWFYLAAAATFVSTWLCASSRRYLQGLGLFIVALVFLFEIALLLRIYQPELRQTAFQGIIVTGAAFGAVAASLILVRRDFFSATTYRIVVTAACFVLLPHAYAFGTGGNYWKWGADASIFWIVAGALVVSAIVHKVDMWEPLLPIAAFSQLATVIFVYTGAEAPYRQPQPLRLNTETAVVGESVLILDRTFAGYFRELAEVASRVGFDRGTPMIDMTGRSPTSLYAIGAKPIGLPWIIGGYPGSDRVAVDMLGRVPCTELLNAWLLVEADGPRKLSVDVVRHFGIDFDRDLKVVAYLSTPSGTKGGDDARTQQVWMPTRSAEDVARECAQRSVP